MIAWFRSLPLQRQLAILVVLATLSWAVLLGVEAWVYAEIHRVHGAPEVQALLRDRQRELAFLHGLRIFKLSFGVAALVGGAVLGFLIHRGLAGDVGTLVGMARTIEARESPDGLAFPASPELGEVARAVQDLGRAMVRSEIELRDTLDLLAESNRYLGRQEEFLRSLVESAPVAIITLDQDLTVTGLNPFAESLLGVASAEAAGRATPALWTDPLQLDAWLEETSRLLGRRVALDRSLVEALAPSQPLPPREFTFIAWDGRRVPVMVSWQSLRAGEGRQPGVLVVATDLGPQKALEAEILEREAEARAANEAKSSFLAAMSHELRTPLIGVTGMVEILAASPLDEGQRKGLEIIRSSARSLLSIIGDILDFSKIEAGRLELDTEPCSLRQIVAEAGESFGPLASAKGLLLEVHVDEAVAPAHVADALRIQQILGNFLSNAVKFTETGGVRLRLLRLGERDGGQDLRFEVEDTGIGVPAEALARLFAPFSQAEHSTTRRHGGTGLGLAISRRLADLMGGEVAMRSEPGQGSLLALSLHLPLADPAELASAPGPVEHAPFPARQAPDEATARREGSLILLAEDHPTNRLVITQQLGLAGFACVSAPDGRAAFELFRRGGHALILADLHMPGLDGYQLAKAVRDWEAEHGSGRIPILALTANVLQGEADRCRAAGMDGYISKPVDTRTLAARILEHLPGLRRAGTVPPALAPSSPRAVWDRARLLELLGEDPQAVQEVMAEFLEATRADLQAARGARGQDLSREAHRIKGAARSVGAERLADLAAQLEALPASAPAAASEALLAALATAHRELEALLQQEA